MLKDLYTDWNEKINVISRKDMDHFYEHHVLHSLAIATKFEFTAGSQVMDLGCGGGAPISGVSADAGSRNSGCNAADNLIEIDSEDLASSITEIHTPDRHPKTLGFPPPPAPAQPAAP